MSFFSNLSFYRNRKWPYSRQTNRRRRRIFPIAAIEKLEDRTLLSADFAFAATLDSNGGSTQPEEQVEDMTVDSAGNTYLTGRFTGTMDVGSVTLASNGGAGDGFVAKYDTNGNFLWARSFGSVGDDRGIAVSVDSTGNVFVGGLFEGTVDFDQTSVSAGDVLTSRGQLDGTLLKLNSSGDFVWAVGMGSNGIDSVTGVAIDNSGNVYTTGSYQPQTGNVDFDPSSGTFAPSINGGGFNDAHVSKFDTSGNLLWAKAFGGSGDDKGLDIAVDLSGNVFTTGDFFTGDLDPGAGFFPAVNHGGRDGFVQKLDTNGNFLWAGTVGGSTSIEGGTTVAVDSAGNSYFGGLYKISADLDPGIGVSNFPSAGGIEGFVFKLDQSGNLAWAQTLSTPGALDTIGNLVVDSQDNVFISGQFASTFDFDPGAGEAIETVTGQRDSVVWNLDGNGDFISADTIQSTGWVNITGMGIDAQDKVWVAGHFVGTTNFGASSTETDIYFAKLANNTPPVAMDDNFTINEDGTLVVSAADGVLANDTDTDGDALTVTGVVSGPANGSITLDADGSFTYIPVGDFNGTDSFTYEISDGNGGTSMATVTIEVLSADSQFGSAGQDVQILIDSGVLNNGQGNALLKQLGAAQRVHNRGQDATAINKLNAFINHMEDLILTGVISDLFGNPLIDDARLLIESLG